MIFNGKLLNGKWIIFLIQLLNNKGRECELQN